MIDNDGTYTFHVSLFSSVSLSLSLMSLNNTDVNFIILLRASTKFTYSSLDDLLHMHMILQLID